MPLLISRSTAQHGDRPVLAPVWLIALLTGMVGGALWLLYPRQDLEDRLGQAGDTELANNYLQNLLRSEQDNPRLRLLLAQRQIAHGDTAQAHATLRPALQSSDPALVREALWTQWDLLLAEHTAATKLHPDEPPAQDALRQHLQRLAEHPWPAPRQRRLASLARQFGETDIAAELDRQELPAMAQQTASDYEETARQALAEGDYRGCAQAYLQARDLAQNAVQAKAYYRAAVAALVSGNLPGEALALAEREAGAFADDRDVLVLLIELARGAGRPETADRYVRRLLQMALLLQQQAPSSSPSAMALTVWDTQPVAWGWQRPAAASAPIRYDDGASLLGWPYRQHLRAVADAAPDLPFDDKTYSLGYQVFLENGKPQDAWLVANAAVRQRPSDMAWRERLAQVSEWTQRPAVALENWLMVARQTGSEVAWQAVLRLAPAQFDDAALAQALRHELRRQPDDIRLLRAFMQAQERLGEPQPALDQLQRHARTPEALEMLALLAERAGQPELALDTWQRLFAMPAELNADRALQAAVLALTRDQPATALRWLEAVQGQTPASAPSAELWRMTAEVADIQGHTALAIAEFRRLIADDEAEEADFDALVRLLTAEHPVEAAQVSLQAWQRFGEPRHVMQALSIHAGRSDWPAFARALALLDATPAHRQPALAALQRTPAYLRMLGNYHQNMGRPAQARRLYETGLALEPGSADMQQALLWLFIDGNDAVALRELLAVHEPTWSRSAELHDALAAAYQALSLPQVALDRYLIPRRQAHTQDFLWLMNYADALEQNQQADAAWRLRRHLLQRQAQDVSTAGTQGKRLTRAQARARWLTEEGLEAVQRIARARLVLAQRPGDEARQVLAELLRLDRDGAGKVSNAAAEAAIGWLQDVGEYSAERAFLWHQYARSHAQRSHRPLWAEITVALAEDDRPAAGQLLQEFDERLPRYDRINAAMAVGDVRLAQSAAFDAQHAQHDDQPLHQQLSEQLLGFSDHGGVRLRLNRLGVLAESQAEGTLHWAVDPRLSVDVQWQQVRRTPAASAQLRDTVHEDTLGARLRWHHVRGRTEVQIARRSGYAGTTPVSLAHEHPLGARWTVTGELGWQLPSEESLALRLAGMKSRAAAGLRYQLTRQDQIVLTQAAERYRLQTGVEVGRARHTNVEYGHAYRQEAPSLEWGAFWSAHHFEARHPAYFGTQGDAFAQRFLPADASPLGRDYFLPTSFRFYGLRLSTNMRFEQDYTRAIRPFASVSRTWHSQLGAGYELQLGVAGSLVGADHLRLGLNLSKSGPQSFGRTRSVELSYRLHF